jgi:L,D-transpeptidase YcbB
VPQSIIVNEYLRKLIRDPGYLDRQGFKVVNQKGKVVSSRSVNWAGYDSSNSPVGVQQPPGSGNALGELKFLFPNKYSIYMHDTPTKSLFSQSMRAFSHGCVRVENPREFARVLLGWDRAKIDRTVDSKNSQSVPLPQKIPIHIAYFTAWPDSAGKMQYFNDIYGRDEAMERGLDVLTTQRMAVNARKLVQN